MGNYSIYWLLTFSVTHNPTMLSWVTAKNVGDVFETQCSWLLNWNRLILCRGGTWRAIYGFLRTVLCSVIILEPKWSNTKFFLLQPWAISDCLYFGHVDNIGEARSGYTPYRAVLSLMHSFSVTSANIAISHILPKTIIFGSHCCHR